MITSTVCGKTWAAQPFGQTVHVDRLVQECQAGLNGGDAHLHLHSLRANDRDVVRQVQRKTCGDIFLPILQVERLCFDYTGQLVHQFRVLERRP